MFGNSYSSPFNYTGNPGGGYTPFVSTPYYNSFPQQQVQQPSQSQPNLQPTGVTNTNKIYVSGIEDVKGKTLYPNSDMIFIDNDKPLLYQKTVDSKGQFEIKVFDICPHVEQETAKIEETINLSNYVLKTDLEPLQAEIKVLNDKISKMDVQKQIDSIKKDEIKPLKKPDNQ